MGLAGPFGDPLPRDLAHMCMQAIQRALSYRHIRPPLGDGHRREAPPSPLSPSRRGQARLNGLISANPRRRWRPWLLEMF